MRHQRRESLAMRAELVAALVQASGSAGPAAFERFADLVLEEAAKHLEDRTRDVGRSVREACTIMCAATWVRDLKDAD